MPEPAPIPAPRTAVAAEPTRETPLHILVTGAAGYIGSVLVRELLAAGHRVRGFDLLLFGAAPLEGVLGDPRFELVHGDLRRLDDFPHLCAGVDAIVHLASLSNDPSCDLQERFALAINRDGTRRLALAAKEAGVRRFVFCSSCSVYGAAGQDEVDEDSPLRPVSLYARTKVEAEIALRELADRDFHPVLLRNATVFGGSPRMRFDLAINVMTLHALRRREIVVLGGGRQWRPMVHLSDVTRALRAALALPEERVSGAVINVGATRDNVRIADLASRVQARLPGARVIHGVGDEPDRRSYRVQFDRLWQILGVVPERSIEEGVDEVAALIGSGALGDTDAPIYYNVVATEQFLRRQSACPAIEGGEPVREAFLPLALPSLDVEEEEEVLETLRSGWVTTGPRVARFERSLADLAQSPEVAATSSCTAALHLALLATGVGPGDEVIVPAITFPATANVVVHCGATPVLADVEPDTFNLDPAKLEDLVTRRTRAIVPVHMAGQPCELDEIHDCARRHGLAVIEDAAHAIGASYRGRPIGSLSDFTAFSFYPIKNMTTIEGGALAFRDPERRGELQEWGLHGMTRDAWKRYGAEAPLHWDVVRPGYKYNMSDVQAAVGLRQLDKLPRLLARRAEIVELYRQQLAGEDFLELPGVRPDRRQAHHLFVVRLRLERLRIDRDAFARALRAEQVGIGFHFRSLHTLTYYRERYRLHPAEFPVADDLTRRILSLPLWPGMSDEDVESVVAAVRKLGRFYRA